MLWRISQNNSRVYTLKKTVPISPDTPKPLQRGEHEQLDALLQGGRLLRGFPHPLESQFRQALAADSAAAFRSAVIYVFFLYIGLGVGIATQLPREALGLWPLGYALLGLVVITGLILSRLRNLDGIYPWYATTLAFIGITIVLALTGLAQNPQMRLGSMIGIMPALAVVGGMLGLRTALIAIATISGGIAGFLLSRAVGQPPDWLIFNQTYTSGCFVAIILGWLAERRNRIVFLQKSMLALEKQRSDNLAANMQALSRQDGLTKLANRRFFDERLSEEWLRCQRAHTSMSLMFIDVDFFKNYNDYYGHQAGDLCLQRIAQVLQKFTKRPGDLAARYGGEEFVLLFPEMHRESARHCSEEVRKALAELSIEFETSPIAPCITASIGVATCTPSSETTPEDLLARADDRLYAAKHEGRNQVKCDGADDDHPPRDGHY